VGAIYALIAMSLNIVQNSSGIINFAQGNLFVIAGLFAASTLPIQFGYGMWFLLLPAAACALGLGLALQGYITLLPLRSSVEQHSWLVTTLAVSVILGAAILILNGSTPLNLRSPFPNFVLLHTRTPATYALLVLLAVFWWGMLHWFHRRTFAGIAMSAIAQDLDAARAAGIRVRRLQIYAFAISGIILGSAGYVAAPVISISNDSGIGYVLNGFVASVIGGLGSNAGALVGGLLVGITAMFAAFQYGGEFQNAVSLALLVTILMVRPQGLFGHAAARRV
jgi:branched-chain amino acid transport system permease protein